MKVTLQQILKPTNQVSKNLRASKKMKQSSSFINEQHIWNSLLLKIFHLPHTEINTNKQTKVPHRVFSYISTSKKSKEMPVLTFLGGSTYYINIEKQHVAFQN